MSNDLTQSIQCDICNKTFTGRNAAILARSLGVHKRAAHGIKGTKKSYYVSAADRKKKQEELDWPEQCPFCPKRTKNRSGMSSHMKVNHPDYFLEWTKDSVKSGFRRKQLQALGISDAGPTPTETAKEEHRAYQRGWYKRNKKRRASQRSHHRMAEPEQNGTQPTPPAPALGNMNVVICPRCKCRFATMIIEEGQL